MSSFFSMRQKLTEALTKARNKHFPGAPTWYLILLFSMPVLALLLMFNDSVERETKFVLSQASALVTVAWIVLFSALGYYKKHYKAVHGKNEIIELNYFGKVVGSLTAAQLAEIEIKHIRDPRKWIRDIICATPAVIRFILFLPFTTLNMTALIAFALYYAATIEELSDREAIDKLLQLGFIISLFMSFTALALGLFKIQVQEDLPRRRKIMAAAGIVGYDPKDILLSPKLTLETQNTSEHRSA
jgi:hypothetical protein